LLTSESQARSAPRQKFASGGFCCWQLGQVTTTHGPTVA
jgi:hypothetical protein